jgi:hypothetical protein
MSSKKYALPFGTVWLLKKLIFSFISLVGSPAFLFEGKRCCDLFRRSSFVCRISTVAERVLFGGLGTAGFRSFL